MSIKDREKWDKKYQQNPNLLQLRPPSKILKRYYHLTPSKIALDLACGAGRNAIFLAQNGFFVDAIDISQIALNNINHPNITTILADLDRFTPTKKYDLIIKANYLDRELIKRAKDWLNINGIFIIETYLDDPNNEKKNSNPAFLLKPNELKEFFDDRFEILEYIEFWNESFEMYRMKKAAIAVRLIA